MTSSEMCPSHVTLTLTFSVQSHTEFYVYLCIYVCSRWILPIYVAALQSGHTVFSDFLLKVIFELQYFDYMATFWNLQVVDIQVNEAWLYEQTFTGILLPV